MEKLKDRMRCASFTYYFLCGMSIVLVIALLFKISILGLLFSLYSAFLFLLGIKAYKLSYLENKQIALAYTVMSIISVLFNFIWACLNIVSISIYDHNDIDMLLVCCYFIVAAFSMYTSHLAWKYYGAIDQEVCRPTRPLND